MPKKRKNIPKDAKVYKCDYVKAYPSVCDSFEIRPGVNIIDGIEYKIDEVWLDILLDIEHAEYLQERYEREHAANSAVSTDIPDHRTEPEACLLADVEPDNPKTIEVRRTIRRMPEDRINLVYDKYGILKSNVEIAKENDVTEGTIRKRLKKINGQVLGAIGGM